MTTQAQGAPSPCVECGRPTGAVNLAACPDCAEVPRVQRRAAEEGGAPWIGPGSLVRVVRRACEGSGDARVELARLAEGRPTLLGIPTVPARIVASKVLGALARARRGGAGA